VSDKHTVLVNSYPCMNHAGVFFFRPKPALKAGLETQFTGADQILIT